MSIIVNRQDPRFPVLSRSRNLRWPASSGEEIDRVEFCETPEDAAKALERIIAAGQRPTIRSGGHCYEDFVVNNPHGTLLDLSLLNAPPADDGCRYRISAGKQLGDIYLELYKRDAVTIPAGTCYTVGAGGHISGGGYGLLSRLYGLTVDWVSSVDILTADNQGRVALRRADKTHDSDLFRACRGAGGGNFGMITGYGFDRLPPAPREVASGGISFDWEGMTESRFVNILTTFGDWWATRGLDRDTWGLFSILDLAPKQAGHFGLSLQFCNPDGTCRDLSVAHEFLDRFGTCQPIAGAPKVAGDRKVDAPRVGDKACSGQERTFIRPWLDTTVGRGGMGSSRAKYKSAYMKQNFSEREARCIYKHLARNSGIDLSHAVVAIDSYGGATNLPKLAEETSAWQRSSIMKLQYQCYWRNSDEDKARLQWMNDLYSDVYSDADSASHAGTPYPSNRYQGCYINYPDCDMLSHSFWPQLYYGTGELYPFLQNVKRRYDPNNIFHHAMSVQV